MSTAASLTPEMALTNTRHKRIARRFFASERRLGDLDRSEKVLIAGDILHSSRVALLSNIFCLQKLGAEVAVCGPSTLLPKHIESLGVKVFLDFRKALQWCEVVNMLRIQLERQEIQYFPSLREYTMQYGLSNALLAELGKTDIIIMHPGPINRGVEITSDIADGKNSIILNQVENGVAIRMAVLYLLSGQVKPTS